jgi:hypothetical protein
VVLIYAVHCKPVVVFLVSVLLIPFNKVRCYVVYLVKMVNGSLSCLL